MWLNLEWMVVSVAVVWWAVWLLVVLILVAGGLMVLQLVVL